MATLPPINAGALKLTFPTNLPKNEKDLICMLLAGRLKDLLNGRLVCAQLAIDDLIKDATGISALSSLRDSLVGMKSAIDRMKSATGYDKILQGVNQALGQVNNVFSLGGLCPSPIRAPMIPDLLGQLNANLFGQGLNILNALGKVSNPSMCLGGGPGGFGINWNSMPGDLRNLKNAIKQAGNTPSATINAFNQNLKSQTSRLKSEVKRLEQNLADPLGLNNKLNTARNLQRAKSVSDGYPVKDSRGILHDNVLKSMVSADIESVIDNGDRTPIKYVTKPILDYCGVVIGYEKVAVTGDPAYIGWDPNGDLSLNTDHPTVNPVAGYASFKYTFKQEGNTVKVYDSIGAVVTDLSLSRGVAYRLNFELTNKEIQFYSDPAYTTVWTEGLTYSRNPEYGTDMEIITPDVNTKFVRGELDWAVLIENPTTPNIVYWKTNNNSSAGSFVITGETSIPLSDRTYDISMAVKKACLHLVNVPASSAIPVNYENFLGSPTSFTTTRTYNTVTTIYDSSGNITSTTSLSSIPMTVKEDTETSDELGNTDPNNKVIKSVARFNAASYLITKRYISTENGLEYTQIYFYLSPSQNEANATYCILLKFDDPITILNSSKLPYTDNYSYKLTRLIKSGSEFIPVTTPISNSDETKFELVQSNGKEFIRWNLTSFNESDKATVPKNEFIFQTDIEIDPTDLSRNFIVSNPKEYRTYFYFKFGDGTAIQSTITLI
jgi:hypothetical protein